MAQADDDIPGLLGDLIRFGTVEAVDLAHAHATVKTGEVVSPPCHWLELAGGFRTWIPPTVGEQVILICPEGDIAGAVILRGIYSDVFPPLATDGRLSFATPDGTTIEYDPATHAMTIVLAAGSLSITAPEGVSVTGDLDVTGKITATTDVVGGGISLKNHKHGGVQAGGAQTGAPA
ncbi:phage baseplate assembly protein V [Sphingobium sp. SCG-1]|uniref:phage baseplate assembly protein V n=1 Tax=Sphingobium sp. SCG-1 TaxID=2072936 RepID=UPI000CD6989E|nr:phage baseplate assembly protein V [Sphingobium sp. SCG-1]AUW59434.1 phage baseplate assembly protein V [Sphingobium sp. SCG-1]